ncbi:hypothetical protein [Labedaea rhizosphaerae]|uniref:Uncharacterized protein n=1 Tax=Labedaea rhizosphaerae TaxID=598644 RepID=A0A4V3CXK5_LABRH|nr:hypothetical protein [Labedaea rhizosphaerae]TDP90618.1 hypothetical protein EV186_110159 [Labedaea rhizosphaerae]
MDADVEEVLIHLRGRLSSPAEFFEAVHSVHEEHKESDFDDFRSAFLAEGFDAGEELIRYLDDNGRHELLAKVVEERPEDLTSAYAELDAEVDGAEDGAGEAADDDADARLWRQAIEQFGAAWADWDGSEAGWAEYRDWFYVATNSQDPSMYAVAYARLDPLNAVPLDARIDSLREFGFTIRATPAVEAGEATETGASYDRETTFPWISQVVDALSDQWDGSDESWPAFRESVLSAVEQQSAGRVDLMAAGTAFLDEVEGAADKRAALAGYGVTIAAGEAMPPEELAEALQQVMDDADIDISQFSEEEVKQALEQALAEVSAEAS